MLEKSLEFLSGLEGVHSLLKTLHWNTNNHSRHILTDEIDDEVLEFEDRIAENVMGATGKRFAVGSLKCLLPEAKDLKSLLNEMESDVKKFRSDVEKENGIVNIIDEFLETINKWKYLETLS